jgi:hypothetical protein
MSLVAETSLRTDREAPLDDGLVNYYRRKNPIIMRYRLGTQDPNPDSHHLH